MADYREAFVGIDVAKLKNAIAVAGGYGAADRRTGLGRATPDGAAGIIPSTVVMVYAPRAMRKSTPFSSGMSRKMTIANTTAPSGTREPRAAPEAYGADLGTLQPNEPVRGMTQTAYRGVERVRPCFRR